jgi:CRP/FNR family cyclic AMP-dependent transcriptional regulator
MQSPICSSDAAVATSTPSRYPPFRVHRVRCRDVTTAINLFRSDTHPMLVSAGQAIFRDGEAGTTMFGVIEGEIAIGKHGMLLETIGPGGIIGEMALIDHSSRSADAVARTDAKLAVIDQTRFEHLVANHPTFALQVMRVMAERLRKTNEQWSSSTE